MAQTCLIFNPVARGGKAHSLRQHLSAFSAHCELQPTGGPGDARRLAAQAVKAGFQTIIAAGGDGTVNEVLNGMGDVPDAFERTRLGILPLGTMNVFARELAIPGGLNPAWEVLQRGREIAVDLPVAEFTKLESASASTCCTSSPSTPRLGDKRERRYFIQLAGAGWDARAVELVSWSLKKKVGPLAYVAAGFKALREARPLITIEEAAIPPAELVLLGNGRYYGGKLVFFPKASLHDGQLDLCVFPKVNFQQILRLGGGLVLGRPLCFCRAIPLQSGAITLTSPGRVPLELDGEIVGELPAKISIHPKALRVVVP